MSAPSGGTHASPGKASTSGSTGSAASSTTSGPVTKHGRNLQQVERSARSGQLSKFNHSGPMRKPLSDMAKGKPANPKQFRDQPQPSSELPSGYGNRGRHEVASTSQRAPLTGKKVPMAVAASARTNTAMTALRGPAGEVVAHSGTFVSGKTTTGQGAAHAPFHAFPKTLAAQSDPEMATAMAIDTVLQGTATPSQIRADPSLTGAKWSGSSKQMEAPDPSRGHDDGYDSGTERGRFARRIGAAREHAKDSLRVLRGRSQSVSKATRSPSPPRSRGGAGKRGARDPLDFPAPPKKKHRTVDDDQQYAHEMTQFSFLGFQTLK